MKYRSKRGTRGGRRARKKKANLKDNGIFNLSKANLSEAELLVLEKGLKFIPPKRLNKFTTFIDIQKYVRKLNVQRYIISNPTRSQNEVTSHILHSGLSNPSLFNPPGPTAPSIKVFRDLVLQDVDKLPMKKVFSDPNIKIRLKQLFERKYLTIRPADKGGGIVILDKSDYHLEMTRILSDTETYSRIPNNPTSIFKKSLTDLIDTGFQFGDFR